MSNYELNVISHHQDFSGKQLKKYMVEGIETVGAYGSEVFSIVFKNNTWQKVQVKLSLDGTCILSGKPATTDVSKDMWVVGPQASITLKAWPETANGGASFVFTSADNSVAVHTHGDLSSRGIIAAAVYTESYVQATLLPYTYIPATYIPYPYFQVQPYWHNQFRIGDTFGTTSGQITCNNVSNVSPQINSGTFSCNTVSLNCNDGVNNNLESLASVGAGQYTDQKITHVAGLIKPAFAETVRVRYLWWNELVAKLKEYNIPAEHASGFPADPPRQMSLGSTPRIGSPQRAVQKQRSVPVYSRV